MFRTAALIFAATAGALSAASGRLPAAEHTLDSFERLELTDVYYSEGANAGDINRDGQPDVVYGPYWYAGPDFKTAHEIYDPQPQPLNFYADNFFNWVYDFNQDGWNDVFVVGFPGTPAYVYENPGQADTHWPKHQVFESVSNESPHFTHVTGDDQPELVCTFAGKYGFATFDRAHPFEAWTFHAVAEEEAPERFGHGLGVGDVNGDGRNDILMASGWFEQPEHAETAAWTFHAVAFTNAYGGAEMYAYDVDGDGDNDVITSQAAHDFGLAWYEQDRRGNDIVFHERLIMGQSPAQNRYGLVFSELHSVALADIDGDGLKDIITGKTYWSHHQQSPMWDAGAVVYWFKLLRSADGPDWLPFQADDNAGIGRQISVHDVNGDGLPDIIMGGMKGCHVLIHRRTTVDEATWKAAQPRPQQPAASLFKRGAAPQLNAQGVAAGAIEGESLASARPAAGQVVVQDMGGFTADRWSGGQQLFWRGGQPGSRLEFDIESTAGAFELEAVFTMARDYAVISISLDGQSLARSVDLFNSPDVITTGVQSWGPVQLGAGTHRLGIEIEGANPSAVPAYMVGLDFLRLTPHQAPAR